jgi:hypothetical protein
MGRLSPQTRLRWPTAATRAGKQGSSDFRGGLAQERPLREYGVMTPGRYAAPMVRRIAGSVVAMAIVAMTSASFGWSASATYTPAQVQAAFLRATGVRLAAQPRSSFPANTNLRALLIAPPGAPIIKSMYRDDTKWNGEVLFGVYDSPSSAEAAASFERREYGTEYPVVRNVLVIAHVGGLEGLLLQTALYYLAYPSDS